MVFVPGIQVQVCWGLVLSVSVMMSCGELKARLVCWHVELTAYLAASGLKEHESFSSFSSNTLGFMLSVLS